MKSYRKIRAIIIIATIFFSVLSVLCLVNTHNLLNKGYNISTAVKIQLKGIETEQIYRYNKTLEIAIDSDFFIEDNIEEYLELDYYSSPNYISSINKLLDIGYTSEDINLIYKKLDDITIETLLYYKQIPNISEYLKIEFFNKDNLFRYLNYYDGNIYNTVLYVNIGLDNEFYTNVNHVNKFSTEVLVNKYNKITKEFNPEEIVKLPNAYSKKGEYYLSKIAATAFVEMCECANKQNIYIQAVSAYRDYNQQEEIYNDYLKDNNKNLAKYVLKPGFSEHHTGLAVDIASKNSNYFSNTKEDLWLKDNAYKFGFILRYPKGKENITGIEYESWHYRYVGKDIAEYIWKNDITFEEYCAMQINNKY